jgi:hypothetical protein
MSDSSPLDGASLITPEALELRGFFLRVSRAAGNAIRFGLFFRLWFDCRRCLEHPHAGCGSIARPWDGAHGFGSSGTLVCAQPDA